jgi:nuclease S1
MISHCLSSTLITALVVALLPGNTLAWGPKGHRLVAALANSELTPQARAEVARLLHGEAEPTLAGVANWADDLRDHPAAGDPDLGKRSARWHYVNLAEDACGYAPPKQCPNGDCLIEAIVRQRALLADRRQPDAVRAQALKFLVHFVGDAHQPLHAGYARDKGGNTIQIQLDGQGSNLHRLWDSDVIASANMSERRYLHHLRRMPLPSQARDGSDDPAAWAEASCRIVLRDGFYPSKPTIEPGYFSQWRPTADAQLRIAGHRLAQMLNATLAASR